jgi:hypothetical protein
VREAARLPDPQGEDGQLQVRPRDERNLQVKLFCNSVCCTSIHTNGTRRAKILNI